MSVTYMYTYTIYIYIYIFFFFNAPTLSIFTLQTLHPDILPKYKPQTWRHVFLPTYGRAEADDAQRLNYQDCFWVPYYDMI